MCMLTFDYPQTYAVTGSAEEQVAQLRAYIWRLVEALNQANDGNRQEAVNDGNTCAALKKKLDKKGGTVDGSLDVRGSVLAQGALQSEILLSAPSMTVHNDAEEASATLSCGGVCAARLTCLSQDGAYQNVRLAVGAPVGDDDAATKKYVDDAVDVADRVTEQGTTGVWTWCKWASGTAELWGVFSADSLAVDTAWGSVYYGTWMHLAVNKSGRKYPFAFTDTPVVIATPYSPSTDFWLLTDSQNNLGTPQTYAPAYACVLPASATITGPQIHYHVIGKYK